MANYKYGEEVTQSDDGAFDKEHKPGEVPPHSGIYRCTGCGREIVAEEGRRFPTQNHHQHSTDQDHVRWKMIVYADHREK
jgi:hypothetical protein